MYAFGHNPSASTLTVNYTLILQGDKYRTANFLIQESAESYRDNRVSKKPEVAALVMGWGSTDIYQGYIISMSTATASTELQLQNFSITLALLDCQPQ